LSPLGLNSSNVGSRQNRTWLSTSGRRGASGNGADDRRGGWTGIGWGKVPDTRKTHVTGNTSGVFRCLREYEMRRCGSTVAPYPTHSVKRSLLGDGRRYAVG